MLDLKFVRENPEVVKENIRKKFQDAKLPLVDEVIDLDAKSRAAKQEADDLRNKRNVISKQIGGLIGNIAAYYWYTGRGDHVVFIGASGAVFSVMGAVLLVVLICRGRLRELSLRQMLVMLAFSLYFGFASAGVSNAAHVGGLIAGFVLAFPLSIGRLNELRK